MKFRCAVCKSDQNVQCFVQLIPCLHYLCRTCFDCLTKTQKVCPFAHCFSPLRQQADIRLNTCEAPDCYRRMAPYGENFNLDCCHEICSPCYDIVMSKAKPKCPLCNASVGEDEEEVCEGCQKTFLNDKMTVAQCCQARLCPTCIAANKKNDNKCTPKCPPVKKKRKRAQSPVGQVHCAGTLECTGEVLRNFPSDNECEHLVCQQCLGKYLEECATRSLMPSCPVDSCRTVYRLDSVLALRVLFPDKAAYFDQFYLEFHFGLEKLKDDSVQMINIDNNFRISRKLVPVKVALYDDDENCTTIQFDRDGTIGDLIREARRELKIAVNEKVYGYYTKENGEEMIISLNSATVTNTIDKFGITASTIFLVDLSGAVAAKRNAICSSSSIETSTLNEDAF